MKKPIMKLLTLLIAFSVTGCSSLMNSGNAVQPVMVKDAKQQIMITTCSGLVEDWGTCNRKANKTCVNGYEMIEKKENPAGAERELTFKCK
jgi:hypothetical protein